MHSCTCFFLVAGFYIMKYLMIIKLRSRELCVALKMDTVPTAALSVCGDRPYLHLQMRQSSECWLGHALLNCEPLTESP